MVFGATLLSALIATVAAPLVSASAGFTGTASTPRGGSSPTNSVVFTGVENFNSCITTPTGGAAGDELTIVITDSAGASTVHFTGSPSTAGSIGTLGATASLGTTVATNDTLHIQFNGHSDTLIETVQVSGLGLSADVAAASGAIGAKMTGNQAGCFRTGGTGPLDLGTTTATGNLAPGAYPIGSTAFTIALSPGSCDFAVTGSGTGPAGKLAFATNPESRSIDTAPASAAGIQNVTTVGDPTANAHFSGEAVSQAGVPACSTAIGSPGSVVDALEQTVIGAPTVVLPGQVSQPVASINVNEATYGPPVAPFATLAGTITFKLSPTGVVFSTAPRVQPTADIDLGGLGGPGSAVACNLSPDRTSCSVTVVSNAGGTAGSITLGPAGFPVLVDVDATATIGAAVKIDASASGGVPVINNGDVVAHIGRIIVGTAAQPVIFIGQNNQPSGTITLQEQAAGFFTAGPGPFNFIVLCYFSGETFTSAPWAIVTVGDLKLIGGLPGPAVPVSQIQGTLVTLFGNACVYWRVFSASTVASTIEIRGSDSSGAILPAGANNGPRLNVSSAAVPGSSQAAIFVGPGLPTTPTGFQIVSNAIRQFANSVSVTASSQPRCLPGATDCLAGNLVITETSIAQLKAGMIITVNILPRATTQRMDVLLQTTATNQTPVATTNASASGLLVTPVGVTCTPSAIFGITVCNFAVTVTQQSFGPTLGTITFSNIHYVVAADAVNGPVNVDVTGVPTPAGNGQTFDAVVSNAIIGPNPVLILVKANAQSAVGKTQTSAAFSVGTKVIHVVASSNNIATIRCQVAPALIGKSVQIEQAKKNSSGVWSAFVKITTRTIGADGFAYFYASTHSAQWLSFRCNFPGDATHTSGRSQAVQVHWI
jgi:hypothetical protein